jgi:hypothetical protein
MLTLLTALIQLGQVRGPAPSMGWWSPWKQVHPDAPQACQGGGPICLCCGARQALSLMVFAWTDEDVGGDVSHIVFMYPLHSICDMLRSFTSCYIFSRAPRLAVTEHKHNGSKKVSMNNPALFNLYILLSGDPALWTNCRNGYRSK